MIAALLLIAGCWSFSDARVVTRLIVLSQAAPRPYAEPEEPKKKIPNVTIEQSVRPVREHMREWTAIEIVLSIAFLVFGLFCLLIQAYLAVRFSWDSQSVANMTGLTLIVVSGLTLVTAGYSTEQMAPVMGLLGTVAGYLLGRGKQ